MEVLGRCGVRTELLERRHGPCPGCGGNDRFRFDDREEAGTWLCSQGGGGTVSGDGIALLEHVTGKEWKTCLRMVGEVVLGENGLHAGRKVDDGVVRRAPRPPIEREGWIPEFNMPKLRGVVAAVPDVTTQWFMERSPRDVRGLSAGEFLEAIFSEGERALVFTSQYSQGDYLWEVGRGGFRLAEKEGVQAVRSKLPKDGGKDGVWYLCNPVDGKWRANPRAGGKLSRRSEESVTGWHHLVLECDEEKTLRKKAGALREANRHRAAGRDEEMMEALVKGAGKAWAESMLATLTSEGWESLAERYMREAPEVPGLWRRLLAMLPVPIKAIYSSGGVSLHALVRVDEETKAHFDTNLRQVWKRQMPLIGADPAAMTPVRLTRLPGCTRGGREQQLIYLNPNADGRPVRDLPPLRSL